MDGYRHKLDSPVFDGRRRTYMPTPGYRRRPVQHPRPRYLDIKPSLPAQQKPAVAVQVKEEPNLYTRALLKEEPKVKPKRQPLLLYSMAAVIFFLGLGISIAGFRTNQKAQAQVGSLIKNTSDGGSPRSTPPSTNKPSDWNIANYTVPPDAPRYIDIPSLSIHSRVLSVNVTKNGALDTPRNVFDTAWYNKSSKPGEPGAMVVDGHISSWSTHGVFYGLNKLKRDDKIIITRGDGAKFTYRVFKNEIKLAQAVDMASLLVSVDTNKPGLNLISCIGDIIPGTNEFNKRIVVYAAAE